MLKFCAKFGSKPCCYQDVEKYFSKLLSVMPAQELLVKVYSALDLEEPTDGVIIKLSDVSYPTIYEYFFSIVTIVFLALLALLYNYIYIYITYSKQVVMYNGICGFKL